MDQKQEKIRQFAALGVDEGNIFREIIRARHLDSLLFRDPHNRDYGMTQEELASAAGKLTTEKFGAPPQPYAYVYSLAMSVDPMLFADAAPVTTAMAAIVDHAVEEARRGEGAVLFAGAAQFVKKLTDIFVALKGRRIDIAVEDISWQEPVALIYDRGRSLTVEELYDDKEKYDYIFFAGDDSERSAELWVKLRDRLNPSGKVEVLLPDSLLRSEKPAVVAAGRTMAESCSVSSVYHVTDGLTEKLFITSGAEEPEGTIVFGEADFEHGFQGYDKAALSRKSFEENQVWDYDVYAANSSPALQTILSAGILDPDFAVGSVFKEVCPLKGTLGTYQVVHAAAVTDSTVREDLVKEEILADAASLRGGDLLMAIRDGRLTLSVVPDDLEGAAAGPDVTVLRPVAEYTSEYLKAYLDGPIGSLFLAAMQAGRTCYAVPSRILRLPLRRSGEEVIAAVTEKVRRTTAALAKAEGEWRKVKRDAVGLMMGHPGKED